MTGTQYREKREALRMNQTDLAKALGVSRHTVMRIEASETVSKTDEYAITYLTEKASAYAR
jgi:DNA-binding XRE family transcriptional regulator